jgi:hypothetical protein
VLQGSDYYVQSVTGAVGVITKIVKWCYYPEQSTVNGNASQLLGTEVPLSMGQKVGETQSQRRSVVGTNYEPTSQLRMTSVNAHFSFELVNFETLRCLQALLSGRRKKSLSLSSRPDHLFVRFSSDGSTHGTWAGKVLDLDCIIDIIYRHTVVIGGYFDNCVPLLYRVPITGHMFTERE